MAGINSGTASIYHLILKRGKSNPIIPVNHIAMPAAGTRLPRCPNSWGSPGCPDQLGFMGGLVRNGIKGTICILYKYNSQPLSLIVNCTPFIYFCLFFFLHFLWVPTQRSDLTVSAACGWGILIGSAILQLEFWSLWPMTYEELSMKKLLHKLWAQKTGR